MLFSKEDKILT